MTLRMTHIREQLAVRQLEPVVDFDGDRAAVAMIFREVDHEPEILLIRRADCEGDPWSGHIAFPGGRVDPTDVSTQATAERETLEEIGLDLQQHGQCIAALEPQFPVRRASLRGIQVTPYVYTLDDEPETYTLNHEVADLYWVSIRPMLRHQTVTQFDFEHEGRVMTFPGFDVNGQTLWGMSFRMLNRLFIAVDADFRPLI